MAGRAGFFDAEGRLRWLSVSGDAEERLCAVVGLEAFRAELEAALPRADRSRGGRLPYGAVVMFRILVLRTLYTLSDGQTEYQLRDRLSFMRFAGPALADAVPDAKTIWLFREQLTRAGALARLFARFDAMLAERGFLAMDGAAQGSSNAAHCWNSWGGGADRRGHRGRGPASTAGQGREGDAA